MEQLVHSRVVLVFTGLLFSIASFAQSASPLYALISGGFNRNVMVGSEMDFQKKIYNNPMSPVTGPTFSLLLRKDIFRNFYLEAGAVYSRKGNRAADNALWNLKAEYISIPLKLGVYLLSTRKIRVGIELGPAFNLEQGTQTDRLAKAYAMADNLQVNRRPFGAQAGGGFAYRISRGRSLFINYTWYHDITPVLSYKAGNATYQAHNQGWMLTAGVMLPLK
jgi:hypothetical protein